MRKSYFVLLFYAFVLSMTSCVSTPLPFGTPVAVRVATEAIPLPAPSKMAASLLPNPSLVAPSYNMQPVVVLATSPTRSGFSWTRNENKLTFHNEKWRIASAPNFLPVLLVNSDPRFKIWEGSIPYWTPDSLWMAFVAGREQGQVETIVLFNRKTQTLKDSLPGDQAITGTGVAGKRILSWLNAKTLAYRTHCGSGCEELWLLDLENGKSKRVFNANGSPALKCAALDYDYSPNEQNIVVTCYNTLLSVFNLATAQVIDLAPPAFDRVQSFEDWSPDSKQIVFAQWIGKEDFILEETIPGLYVWNTTDQRSSPIAPNAVQAKWSPKNDLLAVILFGNPKLDHHKRITGSDWQVGQLLPDLHLVLLNANDETFVKDFSLGKAAYPLYPLAPWDFRPIWSPDGEMLVYRKADNSVWVYSLATMQEKQLWKLDQETYEVPLQAKWSFDGKWLALGIKESILIFSRDSLERK